MNTETARQLLGLAENRCTPADVEAAWVARSRTMQTQLGAGDAATRTRAGQDLAQLAAAKMTLLTHSQSPAPAAPAGSVAPAGAASSWPSTAGHSPSVLADLGSRSMVAAGKPSLPALPPMAAPATPAAAGAAAMNFSPGTVLAGRYELRGKLGEGGMGVVYTAVDRLKRNEEIAIKVLSPAMVSNPAAKERFINEAIIATRLNHSGIVKVHAPEQHGDLIFLTMEKLEGHSLRQILADCQNRGVQLKLSEIVRMARALCDALNYAHKLPTPIVHRDIKPENVFICNDGSLRLMDFGLAQNLAGPQLTAVATTMGTMHYMAPEQSGDARNVDHRADQYSFAVTLYEMLTGHLPQGSFPEPRAVRKTVPAGLSAAVMRGLSTAPGKRFPDMAAFRLHLREDDPGLGLGRLLDPKNRDMLATAALVVVLLGGAAYFTFGQSKSAAPAARPPADPGLTAKPAATKPAAAGAIRGSEPRANPAETGGVSVVTTPAGAQVTLGSQFVANTPARFTNVPVGKYPVRLTLKGYKDVAFELEVVAGNFAAKELTLEPRLVLDSPADFYADTLRLMRRAEDDERANQPAAAQEKWQEALERLRFLSGKDKTWQPLAIAQRIRECQAHLRKNP
jgi:hypothetical protein